MVSIARGQIENKRKLRLGEVGYNTLGKRMEIVRYDGRHNIDIKFDSGYIATDMQYYNFKNGKVMDYWSESLFGVGIVGDTTVMDDFQES